MQSEVNRIRSFYYTKNKFRDPFLRCFLAKNFCEQRRKANVDTTIVYNEIECTICNKSFDNDFDALLVSNKKTIC